MTTPMRSARRRRARGATPPATALPQAQANGPLVAVELMPALLLQAAWRVQPALRRTPLAIAAPGGPLLCVCPLAAEAGVAAGQSSAQARLRAPDLMLVPPNPVAAQFLYEDMLHVLSTLSPLAEATDAERGLAVLDARGLAPLWRADPADWDGLPVAREAVRRLAAQGLIARAGAGPRRVVAHALACRMDAKGPRALSGAAAQAFLAALPLSDPALGLTPGAVLLLGELGVTTAGALAALPYAGVALRFGDEVRAAWQAAKGQPEPPLRPWAPPERLVVQRRIEEGLADRTVLERVLCALVEQLAAQLAARGQAAPTLALHLEDEDGVRHGQSARVWPPLQAPAALTLAARELLAHLQPQTPVVHIALQATDLRLPNAVQAGLWRQDEGERRRARLGAVLAAAVQSHGPGLLRRWQPDPLATDGWRHEEAAPEP